MKSNVVCLNEHRLIKVTFQTTPAVIIRRNK